MMKCHYAAKQYISLTSLGLLVYGAIALPSPSWAENPTNNPLLTFRSFQRHQPKKPHIPWVPVM
ncbi:hypothetical protein [Limnospira platensis]|uniref:hypothetical protein n=1 Tax=Limnospira platensis TaxID=118562 RepID=UPI0021AA304C|nr:hypothetical protein APLC1_3645 [Arthrospira platensis C1]